LYTCSFLYPIRGEREKEKDPKKVKREGKYYD